MHLSDSSAAMAPVVSMPPREASAPAHARGPRRAGCGPGSRGTAPCSVQPRWAGRPVGAHRASRRVQHVVGGSGRGLGPLWEIGGSRRLRRQLAYLTGSRDGGYSQEAARWVGSRPWAWLPGRGAGRRGGPAILGSRAFGSPWRDEGKWIAEG